MTTILVDGQPVEIKSQPLTVLCHPGEMEIEAPDHVLVDPETTVKAANELEPDQWALIREHERFLGWWKTLWYEVPPPENLAKANLAIRHSVGMCLLLLEAGVGQKPIFLKLPETYMHPKQQAAMISFIHAIMGRKL